MNRYMNTFFEEVPWQFSRDSIVEIYEEKIELSESFAGIFPNMANLLSKAVKMTVILQDGTKYWLFFWEGENGIGGWLCEPRQKQDTSERTAKHKLAIREIGNIIESFGFSDVRDDYICNMNWVLGGDEVSYGIEGWEDYFRECCEEEHVAPDIDLEHLVVFAEEANGNLTLCNTTSEEILLFAHDHCFDYVESCENCPEYTFYTIKGVTSCTEYIEAVAKQWLGYLLIF